MKKDFFQSQTFLLSVEELKKLQEALPKPKHDLSTLQTLENYHQSGKVITQLIDKTPYLKKQSLHKEIAKLLKKEVRQLIYFQQLYQHFPKRIPKIAKINCLKWSHVRATLKLKSKEEILFYLNEAAQAGSSVRRLEFSIRNDYFHLIQSAPKSHPQGKIIRDLSPTYSYVAHIVSVIDGDTLELVVEQGFYAQYRVRVRLHGINAPEMHGPQASQAKKSKDFVTKALSELDFIIIKTYQSDAFGRYVADVMYHPLWTDHKQIFEKGFYLNQQLLDRSLAKLAFY